MSWGEFRKWKDMDEREQQNALWCVDGVTQEHMATGALEGIIALLRAGVPDAALMEIAADELEKVAADPRRVAKVKEARRRWERDWDIYFHMGRSKLFAPGTEGSSTTKIVGELASRYNTSDRQIYNIFKTISKWRHPSTKPATE